MKVAPVSILAVLLLLGGCSLLPRNSAPDATADRVDPDLVAQDLVFVLAQIPSLHPDRTSIVIATPSNPYSARIQARLRDSGYRMNELGALDSLVADSGASGSAHQVVDRILLGSEPNRISVSVAVSDSVVRRDYAYRSGETVPLTPVHVSGGDGVASRAFALHPLLFPDAEGDMSRIVVDDMPRVSSAAVPLGVQRPEFAVRVRENVFERAGRSNYAELFAAYENVREVTLVFDNDSMRLGEGNKAVIGEYVREMDPTTDVISVIGCSHGRSALANGNELLSIGRANRVKEAFVYAGIDHAAVLEEACWAPTTSGVGLPPRGVVLSLKRRVGAG